MCSSEELVQKVSPLEPITARCWLYLPPENIRKRLGFLVFSGVIDKQYGAVMGS